MSESSAASRDDGTCSGITIRFRPHAQPAWTCAPGHAAWVLRARRLGFVRRRGPVRPRIPVATCARRRRRLAAMRRRGAQSPKLASRAALCKAAPSSAGVVPRLAHACRASTRWPRAYASGCGRRRMLSGSTGKCCWLSPRRCGGLTRRGDQLARAFRFTGMLPRPAAFGQVSWLVQPSRLVGDQARPLFRRLPSSPNGFSDSSTQDRRVPE